MKPREVSLAFLIIGLLLGGITSTTLSPQRATETVTKLITTTSKYTVTTIIEERTETTTLYLTETVTLTMETTTITNTNTNKTTMGNLIS